MESSFSAVSFHRTPRPAPTITGLGDGGAIVFELTPDDFGGITFSSCFLPVSSSRDNCASERLDSAAISWLLITWSRAS